MMKVPYVLLAFHLIFLLKCNANLKINGNSSTVKKQEFSKKLFLFKEDQQTIAREILKRARFNDNKTKAQQRKPENISNSEKNFLALRKEKYLPNKKNITLNNKIDRSNSSRKVFRKKVDKTLKQEKNILTYKKKQLFNGNKNQSELHNMTKSSNKKPSGVSTSVSDEYQLKRLHALKALIHSVIVSTNANNDSTSIKKITEKSEDAFKTKLNINPKEPQSYFVYNDSSDDIVTTTPQDLKRHRQKLKSEHLNRTVLNEKALDGGKINSSADSLLKNNSKVMIKNQTIYNSVTMDPVDKKHTGIGSFHILFNPMNDSEDYLSHRKAKAQDIIKSIELKVSKMHNNEPAKPDRPEQQIPKGLNLEKIGYEDFWERLEMERKQKGETIKEKLERLEQEMNEKMEEARQKSEERRQERQRQYEQKWGKDLYSRNSALISENRAFHNKKLHDYIFSKYVNSPRTHREFDVKQGNKLMISNEDDDEENAYKQKIRVTENMPLNQEDIEVGALGDSHQWQIISEDSVVKEDTVNNQNKTSVKGSPRNKKKSRKTKLVSESLEKENKTNSLSNTLGNKSLVNDTLGNNSHDVNATLQNSFTLHGDSEVLFKKPVDDSFLGTVFLETPASFNVRKRLENKIEDESKQEHFIKRLDNTKEFIKNSKDVIHLRRNFIYYPQANIFKQARRIYPQNVLKTNVKNIKQPQNEVFNFQPLRRSEVSKDEKTIDINLVLPKPETPSITPTTLKDTQQSLADLIQHTLDSQQKSSANSDSSDKNIMNRMVSDLTRALDRQQMTNEISQITNTLAQTMMNTMLLNQRPQEKSQSIENLEKEVNSLKTRAAVPIESIDYEAAAVPSLKAILKKIKKKNRKLKKLIRKVKKPYLMQSSNIMPGLASQMPTGGVYGGMSVAPQPPPPVMPNIQQAPAPQPIMFSAPAPPQPPPQIIAAPPQQPQMLAAPPPPPAQVVAAQAPTQVVAAQAPTQVVAAQAPTQVVAAQAPTQVVAAQAPTQVVAAQPPTQVVAQAPMQVIAAEAPTQVVADEAPTQAVADEAPTQVVAAQPRPPTRLVAAQPRPPTQMIAAAPRPKVVAAQPPQIALQVEEEVEPVENVEVQQTPIVQQEMVEEPDQNQVYVPQTRPKVVEAVEQVTQEVETPVLTEECQPNTECPDNLYQDSEDNSPDLNQNVEPVQEVVKEKPVECQLNNDENLSLIESEETSNPEEYPNDENSIDEPQDIQTDATNLNEDQQDLPSQFNKFEDNSQESSQEQPYQPVRFPTTKYKKKHRGRKKPFPFGDVDYDLPNYPDSSETPNQSSDSMVNENIYPYRQSKKLKKKKKFPNQIYNGQVDLDDPDSNNNYDQSTPLFSKRRKNMRHLYKNNSEMSRLLQAQLANVLSNSLDLQTKNQHKDSKKPNNKNTELQDIDHSFKNDDSYKIPKPKSDQKNVWNILMKILQSSKQRDNKKLGDKSMLSKNVAERILFKTAIKANKLLQKISKPKLDAKKAFLKKLESFKRVKNTKKRYKTHKKKNLQKKSSEKHLLNKNINNTVFKIPKSIKKHQPVNVWLRSL
ncbi:uncharacterized protein LOC100197306 isoform X2 [Hydra vulgaris]|uniref:Uncharacterized protein LOC100197306 isoform X2 n=1 Tax=Hydra vulgaris TaxID=6087 RepID=A0ABM4BRL2_HYDVU